MKVHTKNASVCKQGCRALKNITEANVFNQKQVCESGLVEIICEVLSVNQKNSESVIRACGALGVVLSNQELYEKYCTPQVIETVKKTVEAYSNNEQLKLFAMGLQRQEDERIKDCIAKGVCTKTAFPKCSDECKCDENAFCAKCCVQQKCYRCLDCDKDKLKLYCEVCWNKYHKDHNCVEFFYPVRCATNNFN